MLTRGQLITAAVKRGAHLTNEGALSVATGKHTGRSPHAKKIVKDEVTKNEVDWKNNQSMSEDEFREALTEAKMWLHERAEGSRSVYTQYVRAGRDPKTSVLVKIVCERPEHALFVQNMFEVVKTTARCNEHVF
jgi:phosphoenolpyruvate carboxykinase (ATP)